MFYLLDAFALRLRCYQSQYTSIYPCVNLLNWMEMQSWRNRVKIECHFGSVVSVRFLWCLMNIVRNVATMRLKWVANTCSSKLELCVRSEPSWRYVSRRRWVDFCHSLIFSELTFCRISFFRWLLLIFDFAHKHTKLKGTSAFAPTLLQCEREPCRDRLTVWASLLTTSICIFEACTWCDVNGAQLTRNNDLKKCVNSFHFVVYLFVLCAFDWLLIVSMFLFLSLF